MTGLIALEHSVRINELQILYRVCRPPHTVNTAGRSDPVLCCMTLLGFFSRGRHCLIATEAINRSTSFSIAG